MEGHADIVVVGGGLAGLIAAATAAGPDSGSRLDVVVLEGTQPGGRARTDERSGYRFNQGAHAVYLDGALRRTLGELGIDPRGGPPAINHTLRLARGRAVPVAGVGAEALGEPPARRPRRRPRSRSCSPRSARSILHRSRASPRAQWLDSLELQPEARQLVSMLVRTATYVDPDAMPISADAAVSQLQMAVAPGVRYIDGGWQTLVDGLLAVCEARGVRVETKSPVVSVRSTAIGVEVDDCHWTRGRRRRR